MNGVCGQTFFGGLTRRVLREALAQVVEAPRGAQHAQEVVHSRDSAGRACPPTRLASGMLRDGGRRQGGPALEAQNSLQNELLNK